MRSPPTTALTGIGRIAAVALAATLAACGSGGGGGTAAPTVQLQADPSDIAAGQTTTLTWSSTNANACAASGGWSGAKAVSGSEEVGPLTATTTFKLQCTGGGGSDSDSATVSVQAGNSTVAGNLLVSTISRSDGDVNDPFAPFAPNDNDEQAQVMPNPVVIGGYVNVPGAGPDGRSSDVGDELDFYRMDLVAGQLIELVIPSATAAGDDADLFLFDAADAPIDENDVPVDFSEGTGQVEQIVVPANGQYFVVVLAFDGASLYRLSVGQSTVSSAASTLRLSDEFIPGELIVTLRSAGEAGVKTSQSDSMLATRFGLRRKGGDASRAMLLRLPDDTEPFVADMTPWTRGAAAKRMASAAEEASGSAPRRWRGASAAQRRKIDTLLYAKLLRRDPNVRSADLNRIVRTSVIPNDPGYATQRWHYELIQLPGAWELTTGNAIRVAVVDTGIAAHPELDSKLVDGRDLISHPDNQDGDGIDADPTDPGCVIGGGSIFHGTHVAGTIGARSNNLSGVAGVSWGARIMPVRVLDGCSGTGSSFDVIQGVRYAAGLSNDSGALPVQRARVINLSLGSSGACDTSTADLFAEVRARGVVVVASAGNDASSAAQTPASCPNVINVAAVGPLRTRAPYSNFGTTVDLAAPGGDMRRDVDGDGQFDGVYSTHASGGGAAVTPTFELLQGTSMAAPHVSGVIALMLSVNADVSPAQIDNLLAQGALTDDIGAAGPDELGMGLINARKAIAAVDPSLPPQPPVLSVTPSSLAFGDIGTTADVVAANAGGGTLTISSVTASEPWLSVTPTEVDSDGLGRYTIAVDRAGLDEQGSYSGVVTFTSTGGSVEVRVLMEVAPVSGEPNAGMQYVLLLDPDTSDNLAQVEVLADDSSVPYRFEGVASREYLVLSGTDLNNDGFICDPAEACGAYPVESAPARVVVDGVVEGLDFVVTYRTGVPTSAAAKSAVRKR
jgi:serine protease